MTAKEHIQVVEQKLVRFAGPLPSPDDLEKYERIQQGFAERIVRMAESQMAHRHQLEGDAVKGEINRASRGQMFAFIIGLAGFVTAGWCVYLNHPVPAAVIGGSDIAGLVVAFVHGSKQRQKELEKRRESPSPPSPKA